MKYRSVRLLVFAAPPLVGLAAGVFAHSLFSRNPPLFFAALVAGTALSLLSAFFAYKVLASGLKSVEDSLGKIAARDGELSPVSTDRSDFSPSLTPLLNKVLDRFRKSILDLKNLWRKNYELSQDLLSSSDSIVEGMQTVTTATDSLGVTTEKLNTRITTSKSAVDSIRASLDEARRGTHEQAAAMEQSSAAIEELISSIHNIAGISEAKKQALSKLLEIAKKGKNEIEITDATFEKIGATTEFLEELAAVIGEIAERTNLLSMNAAIEAAHAGDKGKGFAVVASEIKKLAESAQKNAQSISGSLKGIRANIENAVRGSSSLKGTIDHILTDVEETAASVEEIVTGMTEMSVGTTQISTALSSLVDASEKVKSNTAKIFADTGTLQENIADLESHSRDNFDMVKKIGIGTHQVLESMNLLFRVTDDNSKNLEYMNAILQKEKIPKRFLCDYIVPYQYIEEDRVTGIFTEVVKLVCAELGEEPAIEFVPWDEALKLAASTPDVYIMGAIRTTLRESQYRWIGPVVSDKHFLYRAANKPEIVVRSTDDFRKYRFGCLPSNFHFKYLLDAGVQEAAIVKAKIHTMNIQNLLLGKVDLIPMSNLHATHQLKTMKRSLDSLEPAFPITSIPTDPYLATSPKTSDAEYERVSKAFAKVAASAKYAEIVKRYS